MVARILSIIGIIIILLSLCALFFFPVPTRSFARGLMQGKNLVDSSVGPALAGEADSILARLIEAAGGASNQAELATVVAEATAQADLINTAATDAKREDLITALRAASERIAAQLEVAQAQAAQTATADAQAQAAQDAQATVAAAATETAEAQPTATPVPPTDTPTPIPPPTDTPVPTPDTLPTTGDRLLQVVPTVIVEANWPKQTEVNHSDFIRVTLVQISEGVYAPTVEAGIEREVIAATPKPVPNSTPEVPIQNAFGEGYRTFAVARLLYGETAFEVSQSTPRERQSLDRPEISWTWNVTPKESGQHTVNLLVEVEWEPISESAERPEPYTIWAPDLRVNVAEPPLIVRGQLNLLGLLGTILGGALNIPFLYKVIQNRKKRGIEEPDLV